MDILVNGRLVAKGEVVVLGEQFGIRIVEVASPEGPCAVAEMNFRLTSLLAPLGLLSCSTVFAATDNQPSVIDSSTITEAVGMLAVVLAVIVALGWFVKRYTVQGGGSNVNFDVLGMLANSGRNCFSCGLATVRFCWA